MGCLWRWWRAKGSLWVKVGVYWLFDRWGCPISIYLLKGGLWVYWVTMTGIQLILASFWAINKVMGVESMEYRWEEVDYGYCKTDFVKSGYNICGILQMLTLLHVWTLLEFKLTCSNTQIFKFEWHLFIVFPTKWQCYNHTVIKATLSLIHPKQRHIFTQIYLPDQKDCTVVPIRQHPSWKRKLSQKRVWKEWLEAGLRFYPSIAQVDDLLSELPYHLTFQLDFI